jgi:glycosyltransferase involved in cell wall biosynthesis
LLITYYWPPSGGAGVQRWLKLTDYLTQLGWKIFVVTVDPQKASYPVLDHSLLKEVNNDVHVYPTSTFEILSLYKKVNNQKQIPYAGFANEGKTGPMQFVSRFIRGNFFIPDARIGWNKYAIKKAEEIIHRENISILVTSSPPHSTQLIGLKLKEKYPLHWFADLRDPWTDIYYYHKMNHTAIARNIDAKYERQVIENADGVFVVSDFIKKQFSKKSKQHVEPKFVVLPNGYDEKNFSLEEPMHTSAFTISYNGTIASNYSLSPFIKAMKLLIEESKISDFRIQFTGSADQLTKQKLLDAFGDHVQFKQHVSHLESIHILKRSHLLLLSIPQVKDNEGVLTGKLFEYLASRKPILCMGPTHGDAAKIIYDCQAGITVDDEEVNKTYQFLLDTYQRFKSGVSIDNPSLNYQKYARRSQAEFVSQLFQKVIS